MELMTFENQGIHLVKTNFFRSQRAREGACFVSVVEGAFRLLLPPGSKALEAGLATLTEAKVTRGFYRCLQTGLLRPAVQLVLLGRQGRGGVTVEAHDMDSFHWPKHYTEKSPRCLVFADGPRLVVNVPARYRGRGKLRPPTHQL